MDLQARCLWNAENRDSTAGRAYFISSGTAKFGFVMLGVAGLVAALTTRTAAFGGLAIRAALLLGTFAFVGLWWALPRTRRFLGPQGQRLLVGPTCLVVIDAAAVRVLPAEDLTVRPGVKTSIEYRGEDIEQSPHSPAFNESLTHACNAAASEAARAADRFRAAAARAQPWTDSRVRWSRRLPWLLAAATGLLLGLALETGPLHSRAAAAIEVGEMAERFERDVSSKSREREPLLESIVTGVADAEKAALHDRLLAATASGNEADLRAFLEKADAADASRKDVAAKLAAACALKFPTAGTLGQARVLRRLDALVCQSTTGNKLPFFYESTMALNNYRAQDVMSEVIAKMKTTAKSEVLDSRPAGAPYVELKLTKQGEPIGPDQRVAAVVLVHDAADNIVDQYSLATTVKDPSYSPPTPPTPRTYGDDSLTGCASYQIPCGYGSDRWCCPLGSSCDPGGPPGRRCLSLY